MLLLILVISFSLFFSPLLLIHPSVSALGRCRAGSCAPSSSKSPADVNGSCAGMRPAAINTLGLSLLMDDVWILRELCWRGVGASVLQHPGAHKTNCLFVRPVRRAGAGLVLTLSSLITPFGGRSITAKASQGAGRISRVEGELIRLAYFKDFFFPFKCHSIPKYTCLFTNLESKCSPFCHDIFFVTNREKAPQWYGYGTYALVCVHLYVL